jgi:hypothetical protein
LEYITDKFWVEFQQEIFMRVYKDLLSQKEILYQIYKISDIEFINFVDDCEEKIYFIIKTEFLEQLSKFSDIQICNFKRDFWYFYGIPKKWNEYLIEDINLSYEINSKKYKNGFFIFI